MAKRPRRVGVMANNVGGYSRAVMRGVAAFGVSRGWNTSILGFYGERGQILHDFDGLIVQLSLDEPRAVAERTRVPVVNVSSAIDRYPMPSVVSDDRAVGRLGAEHLLALGHRHLAFYRPDRRQFADLRQEGFIQRCGDGVRASVITEQRELAKLLRRGQMPVAIMGANDRMALAALEAARAHERDCPGEVAVLGVDNDDLIAALADPPLSTVNTARERIGYEAAALLDRLMDGERVPSDFVSRVPPRGVIVRRSTDRLAVADEAVAEAARFIAANAARPIGTDDVAARVAVGRRQLERRFRAALGRGVHEELQRCRIDRAKQLLHDTDLTLAQVADASGFGSASYFATAFRRAVGSTPGDYRQS